MQIPPIKGKLSLEWVILSDGYPALAFDKPTWVIYEQAAAERGQTAQHMIAASVAAAFGHVIADSYAANRRQELDGLNHDKRPATAHRQGRDPRKTGEVDPPGCRARH